MENSVKNEIENNADNATDIRHTILIVDDDVSSLRLLQGILRKGYDTAPARSGEQALTYLRKHTPDMILLDLDMPGMNGYEVLGRLKSDLRWKHIPVIFLTGREGVESEIRGLALGAVDYMQKPIMDELVQTRVKTHLELEMYRKRLASLVEEKTRDLAQKNAILENLQEVIISMMAHTTEYRDQMTGGHIARTREYVALLIRNIPEKAPELAIEPERARNIALASQLHDIGKVAISDAVLLKPGKLTAEEWEIMKTHPIHGADILAEAAKELGAKSLLDVAREIALSHHEKWDGSGYPHGLRGEEIPFSARVTALADVYDALRSTRPYKTRIYHDGACQIIAKGRGTHFDPLLADIFELVHPEFDRLYNEIR